MENKLFFVIEGIDKVGKSSTIEHLARKANKLQDRFFFTKEPGGNGSLIANEIRQLVLDNKYNKMHIVTEILLYAASRNQHINEVIIPRLKENKIVICDRFVDSSLVYQGKLQSEDLEQFTKATNSFVVGKIKPALTFYLKADFKYLESRFDAFEKNNELDRIELKGKENYRKAILGYEELYESRSDVVMIDAKHKNPRQRAEQILNEIVNYVNKHE